MKLTRAIIFWVVVILALLLLEVAQITHLFHLGYSSIISNTLSFVFALVLVTILALVGAVFVGIFIAHRILSPQGFSPFEEEMLKMRQEVQELHRKLDRLHVPQVPGRSQGAVHASSASGTSSLGSEKVDEVGDAAEVGAVPGVAEARP
ncbi:MAG: hypothetical protein KGJ23_14475 [Euryarchaeota archaeon]|nr:hypothetical protein [Euryarchaeota archaeon]MDE1837805.1 hypothetical protein [Euryarchaeota archaeon]MDE1880358.1 hypothetical protein [Euryarchaeota archaeon]MDE2046189.1 hypothetical protein [Thermoplasmata archaeon]